MTNDIVVNITKQVITGKIGFGIPLILSGLETTEIPYTECYKLADVVKAGFTEETEVYKACKLLYDQGKTNTIAVYGATSKSSEAINSVFDKEWRQLIVIGAGKEIGVEPPAPEPEETRQKASKARSGGIVKDSTVKEISDLIESKNDKVFFNWVKKEAELVDFTKNSRTFTIIYDGKTPNVQAAIVGATAGLTTGSFTYKNIVLTNVEPEELSESITGGIHEAGAIGIVRKAGDVVTSEGKTMAGEYLDSLDGNDWIQKEITYQEQKLLNDNPKIPYTNVGISQMEMTCYNVLKTAASMGIIDTDDNDVLMFSTDFASRTEVDAVDRKNRIYNGGKFSYELQGAIHNGTINGTLIIQ